MIGASSMGNHGYDDDVWERALAGDKGAFQESIAGALDDLRIAAEHELTYAVNVGDLEEGYLSTDELVGEVIDRAWKSRKRKPEGLDRRTWLHGLLFRVFDAIVRKRWQDRAHESVSLEARVPKPPLYDDDESFYEWYQPDDVTRWEDVIADRSPSPEAVAAALESRALSVPAAARRLLLLHDRLDVSLASSARILNIHVHEARGMLADARKQVLELGGTKTDGGRGK